MNNSLLANMLIGLSIAASTVAAHEFIAKPDTTRVKAGESSQVSLLETEVYIQPHRLPAGESRATLIREAGAVPLDLIRDEAGKRLVARFASTDNGSMIIAAETQRQRPFNREEDSPLLRMESFSKALLNADANSDLHTRALGTALEIVPMQNPAGLVPGDSLTIKVLFNGEPVSTRVQASYDGYSEKEHGYTVKTQSNDAGLVDIPLTAPGLWLIRGKIKREPVLEDGDHYEASANIVFEVAGTPVAGSPVASKH